MNNIMYMVIVMIYAYQHSPILRVSFFSFLIVILEIKKEIFIIN